MAVEEGDLDTNTQYLRALVEDVATMAADLAVPRNGQETTNELLELIAEELGG
jgi:hypothetical protein